MPKDYSDKLKLAMAEIKAALQKHDIAGYVVLNEPGFSEYLLWVEATWSVARLEGPGIRIRAKAEDFGGDKAAQKRAVEATAGMLRHFADVAAMNAVAFETVLAELGKHFDITHTDGTHTPHRGH